VRHTKRARRPTAAGARCISRLIPAGAHVIFAGALDKPIREAMQYAFDLLELDGHEIRGLPLYDHLPARGAGLVTCQRITEAALAAWATQNRFRRTS
jgi:hypothetical protein